MKKVKFLLGVLMGSFTFLSITIAANFNDITGHWAESNLIWAVNNGLLKGDDVPAGQPQTLRPDDGVTRAEMVTILKRYNEFRSGKQNNEDGTVFKSIIDGITWLEREVLNDKGESIYQAVKIDALGNETILYEMSIDSFGDIEWNFSDNGKNLVLKGRSGGPEGASYREIAFEEGNETLRSNYDQYGSFQYNLSFQLPSSPIYTVALNASGACEGAVPSSGEVTVPQVKITGVTLSSEKGSQQFNLEQAQMADCAIVDGGFQDNEPQNIKTGVDAITFSLPNGDTAWIDASDGSDKLNVSFY